MNVLPYKTEGDKVSCFDSLTLSQSRSPGIRRSWRYEQVEQIVAEGTINAISYGLCEINLHIDRCYFHSEEEVHDHLSQFRAPTISFEFNQIIFSEEVWNAFVVRMQQADCIKRIVIKNCQFRDFNPYIHLEVIKPKLNGFSLEHFNRVPLPLDWVVLLKDNAYLKELSLENIQENEQETNLIDLENYLRNCTALESVELKFCEFSDATLEVLIQSLGTLPSLQTLSLSSLCNHKESSEKLLIWRGILNSNIKNLTLKNYFAEHLVSFFIHSSNLEKVDLSYGLFNTFKPVLKLLEHHPKVETILLNGLAFEVSDITESLQPYFDRFADEKRQCSLIFDGTERCFMHANMMAYLAHHSSLHLDFIFEKHNPFEGLLPSPVLFDSQPSQSINRGITHEIINDVIVTFQSIELKEELLQNIRAFDFGDPELNARCKVEGFIELLKRYNLQVGIVPKEDCLFHSIVDLLNQNFEPEKSLNVSDLQCLFAEYLSVNESFSTDSLNNEESPSYLQDVEKMAQYAFVGGQELNVLSKILGRKIVVLSLESVLIDNEQLIPSQHMIFGKEYEGFPLNLYFEPVGAYYRPVYLVDGI